MTRFCLLLLALLCLGADIAFGGSEPPPSLAALLEDGSAGTGLRR